MNICYFYRPQKKLREGNVFTGFCLFTGVCPPTMPWGRQTPRAPQKADTPSLRADVVNRRAVRILLECILVYSGESRISRTGSREGRQPIFTNCVAGEVMFSQACVILLTIGLMAPQPLLILVGYSVTAW